MRLDTTRLGLRRGAAVVAIGVMLLSAAGCARPSGVDGSLTDDWPAFGTASVPVPAVGSCYNSSSVAGGAISFANLTPWPCANLHNAETVSVGTFTGDDAKRDSPPPLTGSTALAMFDTCGKAASDYVGGDWHDLRLESRFLVPTEREWQGGARFYVCDVFVIDEYMWHAEDRTGSVRDVVHKANDLSFGCNSYTSSADGKSIEDAKAVPCANAHNAEYAGHFVAPPGAFPSEKDLFSAGDDGCGKVVAAFLGMTPGQFESRSQPVGYYWRYPHAAGWQVGDRSFRCWVTVLGGRTVRTTLRGLGSRALPA